MNLPRGASQIGASLVVAVKRGDPVIVRASQVILPRDHFNVVGHSCAEAIPRLHDLIHGEIYTEIGGIHLRASRFDLGQSGL